MKLELYKEIALTRNLPEYELKTGDIATLIDFVPHPTGGEDGCILEVFNAVGDALTGGAPLAIAVITVPLSGIKPLSREEILTIRSLTKAN